MAFNLSLNKLLTKLFNLDSSEEKVQEIKQEVTDKVNDASTSIKRAGKLQQRVMRRTTTYYIARASGVLK